ncbi:hypothetical protein TNCV_2042951 [Trichonephila clavipes]|nr:hypothetical protein TNCV_2042951 [Trichonephila clavipes]
MSYSTTAALENQTLQRKNEGVQWYSEKQVIVFHNKDGLKILEDCLKKRKIGSHYFGALSSCNMTLKDQIIAVIEHYPPHVNPLNHVVNQLLVICNKSMQDIFEGDKLIIPLSPLPEFPTPPQSLDAVATPEFSSSTVFLNGYYFYA